MSVLSILKPGMIGVNLKGRIDLMGTIDTVLQGDTEAAHVWWVLPSGKIATTGAQALIVYGEADPAEYLKGKSFFLLETVDPLTSGQLAIMQAAHQQIMRSGVGRVYGIWKFAWIWTLATLHGEVDKTGKQPKKGPPFAPICSQAVAYPFWSAGVPVGKMFGKQDWTAVLPETILKEAKAVGFMLADGQLEQRAKPCCYLKTVQDRPFIG
jgi:hypothetical protein